VAWIERGFEEDVAQLHPNNMSFEEMRVEVRRLHGEAERNAYWQGYTDAGLLDEGQINRIVEHTYLVTQGAKLFAAPYLAGLRARVATEISESDEAIAKIRTLKWDIAEGVVKVLALIGATLLLVWGLS
jgi:hypothetical protein